VVQIIGQVPPDQELVPDQPVVQIIGRVPPDQELVPDQPVVQTIGRVPPDQELAPDQPVVQIIGQVLPDQELALGQHPQLPLVIPDLDPIKSPDLLMLRVNRPRKRFPQNPNLLKITADPRKRVNIKRKKKM
jgi:hypothetical protein